MALQNKNKINLKSYVKYTINNSQITDHINTATAFQIYKWLQYIHGCNTGHNIHTPCNISMLQYLQVKVIRKRDDLHNPATHLINFSLPKRPPV